jgi:hypothetical protein
MVQFYVIEMNTKQLTEVVFNKIEFGDTITALYTEMDIITEANLWIKYKLIIAIS